MKKESMLDDNEVREVAKMQMTIDIYESFISTVNVMILRKKTDLNYLLFNGTPLTKEMKNIWRYIKDVINESKEDSETA